MMAPKQKVEHPGRVLARLFSVVLRRYKWHCLLVLLFILGSTAATVSGNLFLKTLIDDYILPYIGEGGAANFGPLLATLIKMGGIFLFGVLCTLAQSRIMVYVSQGTMRTIRGELFRHMQSLPLRYFDTHAHGDIMSVYTNDIDTLRQMIGQSMPQLVSAAVTIVSVFCSMLALSLPLTGLTLVMVCVMLFTTKRLTGRSGAYFVAQQRNLGAVNGYIEEMMEGQKVVKVFCREEKNTARFNALNDTLFDSAYNANRFANILGPVMNNIGNLSYVLTALLGSVLAVTGFGGFTLGGPRLVFAVQQKLQSAGLAGFAAVQLHHHGAGRGAARVPDDGRGARNRRGLCRAGERRAPAGRHAGRVRGAHRPLGVEALSQGRGDNDLPPAEG